MCFPNLFVLFIRRVDEGDAIFMNLFSTRRFLGDLEAGKKDQPRTLNEDLRILRASGIAAPEVLWKEYREAVIGGPKNDGV